MAEENNTKETPAFDIDRLKSLWEHLQKEQADIPCRKGVSISSVRITDDGKGHKSVQINLSNGGKINDIGNKQDVFLSMAPKRRINIGRLLSLLEAVRSLGFAAVAMGLPPELKRALLKACNQCGIPLKVEKKKQNNIALSKNKTETESFFSLPSLMSTLRSKENEVHSCARMTSPNSLDILIHRLQKQNKEYLADRLHRCEHEIKEEFFDNCRKRLATLAEKNKEDLTPEERQFFETSHRLGLTTNKNAEKPTAMQRAARTSLTLNDLPQEFRKKYAQRKQRYCHICRAKNKALEITQIELMQKCHKNKNFDFSENIVIQTATAKLPAKEKWDQKTLARFTKDMGNNLKTIKQELTTFRQEKRKEIAAHLINIMESFGKENNPAASRKQQQTATKHRQSFIQNVVVQNLTDSRQMVR